MYKFNHSPELTPRFLEQINKACKLQFYDSSWHNDLVDSITAHKYDIQIWLPNSKEFNPDEELFDTFSIWMPQDADEASLETNNINELIGFIQSLTPAQLIAVKNKRESTLVERVNESQLRGIVHYYVIAVKYHKDYFDDPDRSRYSIMEMASVEPEKSIEDMQKYHRNCKILSILKIN